MLSVLLNTSMEIYFQFIWIPVLFCMIFFAYKMLGSLSTLKKECGFNDSIFSYKSNLRIMQEFQTNEINKQDLARHMKRSKKLMLFWILFLLLFTITTFTVGVITA